MPKAIDWACGDGNWIGDRLVFLDMAHNTMVKNNNFCGLRPPAIATWDPTLKNFRMVRTFDYEDFKMRRKCIASHNGTIYFCHS